MRLEDLAKGIEKPRMENGNVDSGEGQRHVAEAGAGELETVHRGA